ncbi:PDZ domain-containing protein [Lysobacter sp. TY2-98]|uniref:PDZ domain-containing protein n=1 Tax=Lysobacter sp. TY2-98 TaxID=2290922 RepID=UPI000E20715F|nr:PDZ domain-containing protein [Lysobacter sp. TY2-98]AXK71331.1 PDZ domain-containing protein [Lysobacter sp. TY2-98]
MYARIATRSTLAIALAATFAFGAFAQSNDRAQKEKELADARTRLEQDAKRVAELSRELGVPGEGPMVIEHRMYRRPVLGVLLEPDAARGVLVAGVTPDSGAAAAGLRAGDRITGIDGRTLTGADGAARLDGLRSRLADLKTHTPVKVDYERDGRKATVNVTPKIADRMMVMGPGGPMPGMHGMRGPGGPGVREIRIVRGPDGEPMAGTPAGVDPGMHREIVRIARDGACKDGDKCEHLALAEAFRWNGLNLASVDAQLGRYFGTDRGVLVVSAGADLAGLQAGDVIRKVDGRDVRTPRDVMDVLRTKPEDATVAVEYLRDRKSGTAQIKVPKPMRFPMGPMRPLDPGAPMPPPPPAGPEVGMQFDMGKAPIAMIALPPPPRVD